MRPRRASARAALAFGALALIAAAQDAPRSILPEDVFGKPAPPPAVAPPTSVPGADASPPGGEPGTDTTDAGAVPGLPTLSADPGASAGTPGPALNAANPLDTAAPLADLSATGLLSPAAGGYGPGAFSGGDGRVLAALMDSMRAPVASRWAHIMLVRALASVVPTPAGVRPADWVAARTALLMRLGEADVAHALASGVPVDRYTPKLYAAAFDAALAAGDPAATCPLAQTGQTLFRGAAWRLAAAMCAGFDGDDIAAAQAFQTLRGDAGIDPIDISLAERLAASAGEGSRLGANVEWGEAESVNLFRLGLATAAGTPLPDRLLETLPAPARGWLFRAASAPDATRAAAASAAAAQGIAGAGELAAFWASLADDAGSAGLAGNTAARLRTAYAGGAPDRVAAMRALWEADGDRYGALVLTAGAAAGLRPDARFVRYAPEIMESALAGGRADVAMAWWKLAAADGGSVEARAWALAATADADARIEVTPERFERWRKGEVERDAVRGPGRARLFLAALDGLGRARGSEWDRARREAGMGAVAARWATRIDAAAAAGRVGEIAVLAGTGLQTGWASVPPAHLAHILAALVRVGRATEARLIAAEAVTRG